MNFFSRFTKGKEKNHPMVDLLYSQSFISKNEMKEINWLLDNTQLEIEDALLRFIPKDKILFVKGLLYDNKYEFILYQDLAVRAQEETVNLLSRDHIMELRTICLQEKDRKLEVAMDDPDDEETVEKVEQITGKKIERRFITLMEDIKSLYRMINEKHRKKNLEGSQEEFSLESENDNNDDNQYEEAAKLRQSLKVDDFTLGDEGLGSIPVGMRPIVDAIIKQGLLRQASDIHIEASREGMKVRYRIDGILSEDDKIDGILNNTGRTKKLHDTIVNIIKNRSGESGKTMRLDETGKAQDGRIYIPEVDLDLRVSIIPTILGESVVIRIHYREIGMYSLDKLGFDKSILKKFKKIIQSPYGILFVSGPTGSGKTTTLYSVMQIINEPSKKILTIEDPVEYSIPNANQAQINPAKGFGFDAALRAFLRHDPDIIMVGEIRDRVTATMAMEAALTGHLVLSSIHANNAVSTITRLKDLGVDTRLITATCLASLGQRLVRCVCNECKRPFKFSTKLYNALESYKIKYNPRKLVRGAGCETCNRTGYRGRIGVFELLPMTYEVREAILQDCTEEELFDLATKQGMQSLLEDAVIKVANGVTTEEEVWRVTLLEGSYE